MLKISEEANENKYIKYMYQKINKLSVKEKKDE